MEYPILIFGDKFLKKVLPEIKKAKRTIDIIVFYWSLNLGDLQNPVSILVAELQKACKRGVKVRVLSNNYAVLETLSLCGFDVRHCYTSKLMHPKAMLIDNEIAVIGSHNYTLSGFKLNMEISIIAKLNGGNNELSTFFTNQFGV